MMTELEWELSKYFAEEFRLGFGGNHKHQLQVKTWQIDRQELKKLYEIWITGMLMIKPKAKAVAMYSQIHEQISIKNSSQEKL